jgi:hypothetical protein
VINGQEPREVEMHQVDLAPSAHDDGAVPALLRHKYGRPSSSVQLMVNVSPPNRSTY